VKNIITLELLKKKPQIAEKKGSEQVRIWSGEWHAYWRPEARGYTMCKQEAGIYTLQEALKVSGHCSPCKKIKYELAEKLKETRK